MGVGRILSPSVFELHGFELGEGVQLLPAGEHWSPRAHIRFVGASDTAGHCVDGTEDISSYDVALNGWAYSNCDRAYPGEIGRRMQVPTHLIDSEATAAQTLVPP